MNIAFVYPAFHKRGGVERVVWELSHSLADRHAVTVITDSSHDGSGPVTVLNPSLTSKRPFHTTGSFAVRAKRALKGLQPDVAVSFGTDCPHADVLVMGSVHRAWLEKGGPLKWRAFTLPGWSRWLLPRHLSRVTRETYSLRYRRPRLIVAVSQGVRSDLGRLYDVPAVAMSIVPNGFDPVQCNPERRRHDRTAVRRQMGIRPEERVLLLAANEYHRKGLAVLLNALARLSDPSVRLVLAGRMAPDAYESQMVQLGIRPQVMYAGSFEDIGLAYAASDLLVLPTHYEAFGNVIIESLACGLPVIASRIAGASVAVAEDVNGMLQRDPSDVEELLALLRHALEPGVLARWSANAPQGVRGYEWQSVAIEFERVILEVARHDTRHRYR